MKINLNTKSRLCAGKLSIKAENIKVTENGKDVKSQWIPFVNGGILLLELERTGQMTLNVEKVAAKELPTSEIKLNGAFPKIENVVFHDLIVGATLPEKEKEEWAGKAYKFKNDKHPKIISSIKGELANVVKVTAMPYDDDGKLAPNAAVAEYTWIFWQDLILGLSELSGKGGGQYAYQAFAPQLNNAKRFVGGRPYLEGELKNNMRLDGFAALTDGDAWAGVYSAGVFMFVPDSLLGGCIDSRECCNYGNEVCSAWMYFGKDEKRVRSLINEIPTDCIMRLVEENSAKEYVSGEMSIRFYNTESGAAWSVKDKVFASAETVSVFKIKTANGEYDSLSGWKNVEYYDDKVVFSGRAENPLAKATLRLKKRESGLGLTLSVSDKGIYRVCFPNVNVSAQGRVDVLEPSASGKLEKDVLHRDFYYRESYPGPFANMSFVGAINEEDNGFYVCWEGEGQRREYNVSSSILTGGISITSALWPEDMGITENYTTMEVAILSTENGWRGMCREYRKYAEKACWCTRANKDPEKKIEENRFWLWSYFRWDDENGKRFTIEESIAEWMSVINKIADKMNARLGIMAYDWQATLPLVYRTDVFPELKTEDLKIGAVSDGVTQRANVTHPEIGTNYMPHYLPAKEGFKEAVQQLHDKDMRILPYMDNRLWDPRDSMLGNFEQNWENTGKRISCKNEAGEPYMEYYAHYLPDGTAANSAVECPHTEEWQDINAKIVIDLVKEYGVDGVYLDQIAAMSPALCMDKSHGHPIGGGTWWREGYDKMLAKMRDVVPNAILTSECEAEPYMADHDAYLSWTHVLPDQVPAYSAVYSDKIIQYGRTPIGSYFTDYPDMDGVHEVRAMYAQSYLFGEQLGFMFMRAMLACGDKLIPFLNKLMAERDKLLDYFNHGELVDMPEMQAEEEICYRWGRDLRPVVLSRIISTVWKYEGKSKLLLANPFDNDGVAVWKPKKGQFGYGKTLIIDGKEYNAEKPFTVEMQSQTVLTLDLEIKE